MVLRGSAFLLFYIIAIALGDPLVSAEFSAATPSAFLYYSPRKRVHQPSITKHSNHFRPLVAMATRGGGPRKSSKHEEQPLDPDEKMKNISSEALSSIQFCYKACFAGFLAALFETAMEFDVVSQKAFTWIELVDVCDSLNLLVFGLGLRKVASIYAADYEKDEDMSGDTVFDLCSTMSSLWRNTALVVLAVSMVLSASLLDHLPFVAQQYAIPSAVAGMALTASFILAKISKDDASKVVQQERNEAVRPGYEKARSMGFVACRNMRLCTGMFALMAVIVFAKWVLTPTDLVSRIFSVFDFITPGTIAGLQLTLYKSFLRAVVNVTGGSRAAKPEEFSDLLEAQKGFYKKVGDTVASGAVFGVLPYVFTLIKPFLVKVVKVVAPSFAGEL